MHKYTGWQDEKEEKEEKMGGVYCVASQPTHQLINCLSLRISFSLKPCHTISFDLISFDLISLFEVQTI